MQEKHFQELRKHILPSCHDKGQHSKFLPNISVPCQSQGIFRFTLQITTVFYFLSHQLQEIYWILCSFKCWSRVKIGLYSWKIIVITPYAFFFFFVSCIEQAQNFNCKEKKKPSKEKYYFLNKRIRTAELEKSLRSSVSHWTMLA